MEGLEAFVEDGLHQNEQNNPDNLYVELNNKPSELLRIVKYLKNELHNVKEDNEIILRAQEELNQILWDKLHKEWKGKRKEHEYESGTISYKCKGKKLKFSDNESNSSSGINVRSHKEKHKYSIESSNIDNSPKKRKYKPYEEICGEFKKIKPPMFNGDVEKGEEVEECLSGMKKYFQN